MKNYLFLILSVFFFFSCSNNPAQETKVTVKTPQDVNKITTEQLKELFGKKTNDSLLVIGKDSLITLSFIKQVMNPEFSPLWTDAGKLSALGDSLFAIIKSARHYALYSETYHFSKINSLVENFYDKGKDEYNTTSIAQAEALMYDAYLKFGAHINKGRFYPDSLLLEWKPSKLDLNWVQTLNSGIKEKNLRKAIESLEPKQEGYIFLRDEFRKYIYDKNVKNFDSIPFTTLPDTSKLLKIKIAERLKFTGEYDSTLEGNDSVKLSKALKRFQKNWNMDPDGKVGKLTKQALGINREKVIRQMEMALERWRWEEEKLPNVYFWINIPSFTLRVMEDDTLVIQSNVVCGKPENQTPLLKSRINFMLIYPYWNVPPSIAGKEILPAVQRDSSYLRKKNFEIIDHLGNVVDNKTVKWRKYNRTNLPYRFRQRIGEDNSLGIVKFNFNNPYGVYLHDTNSKRYFKTAARSQSHGCIRLEKYMDVARFLIREDTLKLPYDTLLNYLATPIQRKIDMKKKFPIYTKYFTAVADSANRLQLYLDIYRKDEKMMQLIYRKVD
ncbi:MAG: L,D-transpeptidase family protein [Bacteroidia bacterium]|nr:L,D-transpeptidase family protein [Bacteroidia bacterium]